MGNKQPKQAKNAANGATKQKGTEQNGRKTTVSGAGLQPKPVTKRQKKLDYAVDNRVHEAVEEVLEGLLQEDRNGGAWEHVP